MNAGDNRLFPSPTPITSYVSIGSNIDAEKSVHKALLEVSKLVSVVAISTLYQTQFLKADGTISSLPTDTFVNGVFAVQSTLTPQELRDGVLRRVEIAMGRLRNTQKFDARKIDLDLVLHGNLVLNDGDLRLPRPDIRTRDFVAIPLLEIAPQLVLPDTHERLETLCAQTASTNMQPLVELTHRVRKDILK